MESRLTDTESMVRVRALGDEAGIEFFESGGNAFARLRVDDPTSIAEAPTDPFPIPVARAFTLTTEHLTLDQTPPLVLRGSQGGPQTITHRTGATRHRGDPTVIELCLPLKVYVLVEGGVTIACQEGRTEIDLDTSRVRIGVRAPTHTPSGEITTTTSIEDVFATVSALAANIAEFRPARAFPTERAHPPTVGFGDAFDGPDTTAHPDTDVVIEAPPTYLHAGMAAPVAYFLGAELRPANTGAVLVGQRTLRDLGAGSEFGAACTDVLRRCLLGESVLAAEAWYDIQPAARATLNPELAIDWDGLAEADLSTRVEVYLDIPAAAVEPVLPGPLQRVYVAPTEALVESLPFLAYDLAAVRPPEPSPSTPSAVRVPDGGVMRAGPDRSRETWPLPRRAQPRAIGDDIPVGQHPAFPAAFYHRVARAGEDTSISIRIVCNDPRMSEELDDVRARYGARTDSPIDVKVAREVTPAELRGILEEPTDYLHYIGHIDGDGFVCTEGHLDAVALESTAVELFFLNSCESAGQAVELVAAGACGGIATHHRVRNTRAVGVGSAIARGLACGFPLGLSLAVAGYADRRGEQYTIIGDPKSDLTATESGIPYTCRVREVDENRLVVAVETHLTTSTGPGSLCSFRLNEDVPFFVHPTQQTFEVDRADLIRFLELEDVPVWMDGELYWSEPCIELLAD